MGAFLDKPKTEKHNETGDGNNLSYGLSSMQGWRIEMEDAHCAMIGLPGGLKDWSFFAVFDGHAGARVSAVASEELLNTITSNEDFKKGGLNEQGANGGKELAAENIKRAIKQGFLALDDRMREMPEVMSGEDKSGSTAVCVMISPTHLFFANCGDSRAVMCRKSEVAFSTQDHKPINPEEKTRIQNAGGSVMIQRVNGSLAVSRALGDFEYKNVQGKGPCEQLVSPEPEIFEMERTVTEDEFVILACDGIWDVMSNEELCAFVRNRMMLTDDLKQICNQVVDVCLHKGSRDNMSIVIIAFEGAPKVTDEAKQKEKDLDALLEEKIKEVIDKADPSSNAGALLSYVHHSLSVADIEELPPGGGLYAKRATIEEILNRLNPNPNPTPPSTE